MNRAVLLVGFVAVVMASNSATSALGVVTFLGLTATAGTWVAGLGLVLRDWLQDVGGRRWVLAAIATGTLVSATVSPTLAVASGAAFALSELADWAVYTPLAARNRLTAAVLSNTVGATADSLVFLALAGFPMTTAPTQVLVKVASTTLVVLVVNRAVSR